MPDVAGLFDPIIQIFMIAMRAGTLWMFFPIFGNATIPRNVRVGGMVILSVALLPSAGKFLPHWSLAHPPELPVMVSFAFRELLIGAGLGLVARWIFAAAMAAGHWVGMQMGFSMGGMMNPEFQTSESSWAEFHNWLALMVFFGVGGHLLLIQAVADSYQFSFVDFGARLTDPRLGAEFWTEIGTRFFGWMLKLAGPLAVVLLLLQSALGILSRFVPQINVWSVSIPITLVVGVLVFALLSPMYGDALTALFNVEHETNYLWLRAMGGASVGTR